MSSTLAVTTKGTQSVQAQNLRRVLLKSKCSHEKWMYPSPMGQQTFSSDIETLIGLTPRPRIEFAIKVALSYLGIIPSSSMAH